MTARIDYSNYKHEVEVLQGKTRANIYLSIWAAALRIAPQKKQRSLFGSRA